jgi:hypothetical protein
MTQELANLLSIKRNGYTSHNGRKKSACAATGSFPKQSQPKMLDSVHALYDVTIDESNSRGTHTLYGNPKEKKAKRPLPS